MELRTGNALSYVFEKEVKTLMIRDKIPFREAQTRVRAKTPVVSYRDVASRRTPTSRSSAPEADSGH